jgi:hypothetical protein
MAAKPNSPSRRFAKREGILLKTQAEEVAMAAQVTTILRTSTSKGLEETIITTHPQGIISIGSLFRIRRN